MVDDTPTPDADKKRDASTAPTAEERPQTLAAADHTTETLDVRLLHEPIMRERRDPRDGYEPIPIWLVALFGGLLFFCGVYMAVNSGNFEAGVLDQDDPPSAGGAADAPLDPIQLGAKIYKARCVSCHQAQGQGVANQYPPLAGSRWVIGDAEVTRRILLHGLQGPIEVLGKTYNGNMPAFARQLSDEQIAAVITYIRQAWGNEASAVDTASVTRSREATRDQREPYRAEEVENATPPPAPAEPAAPESKSEASDK